MCTHNESAEKNFVSSICFQAMDSLVKLFLTFYFKTNKASVAATSSIGLLLWSDFSLLLTAQLFEFFLFFWYGFKCSWIVRFCSCSLLNQIINGYLIHSYYAKGINFILEFLNEHYNLWSKLAKKKWPSYKLWLKLLEVFK